MIRLIRFALFPTLLHIKRSHLLSAFSLPYSLLSVTFITALCLLLPCAGVGAIVWTSDTGSSKKTYFTGPIKITDDPRFKLETNGNNGNSLVISDVQASDTGTYSCKVHESPEGTISHTVNVKCESKAHTLIVRWSQRLYLRIVSMEPREAMLIRLLVR